MQATVRRLIVFILVSSGAAAQDTGLHVTVIAGAGGTVRADATAPIHVLLRNTGPGLSAVVLVQWLDSLQTVPRVTDFESVELPQNSTKRITLYSEPNRWANRVRITVREYRPGSDPRSGRRLAEFTEPVTVLEPEAPVLGIVGPQIAGLPQPVRDGKPWGRSFFFAPDFLPAAAAGWELCDAVVYTPAPDSSPSAAELRALRDYVLFGGDLVLHASAPSPVFESAGFAEFVPFVPAGQEQRFVAALDGTVIHAVGRVHRGEVLLEQDGVPLIIRRSYGLGSVTVFALDMNAPVFAASGLKDSLWRRILPELHFIPEEDQGLYALGAADLFTLRVENAVTSTPDVRIQLFVVVLLIGLYALAVGPGDYLLARRYQRPMLTWITFPSMVLVFTSVAFLGARIWVGGDEELHIHRSVTWFPEGALHNEAVGYFSSVTGNYALGAPGEEPLRPAASSMNTPDVTLIDNATGERLQRIPTWTARAFTRQYVRDAAAPVSLSLELDAGAYRLTITNDSDRPIQPLTLTVDGRHIALLTSEIVPIAPGERAELVLPAHRGSHTRATHGRVAEVWDESLTLVPRYRSWDHRPLAVRRDSVLTVQTVDPEPAAVTINGQLTAADSTVEYHHVVVRRTVAAPDLEEEAPL